MSVSYARRGPFSGLLLPLLFLLAALTALALFGFLGLGRGSAIFAYDMRYLYGAGAVWLQGGTPYDVEAFKAAMLALLGIRSDSFAYPPNAFPLAALLASGPPARADTLIGLLNVAALLFLVMFVHRALALRHAEPAGVPLQGQGRVRLTLLAAALVVGNPFTAHVVWMGQTTLVSAALVYGCWLCACRRMDLVAGLLLGLSAFKPQIAFLVGLWFLLDRRWLLLAAAAFGTLAASLWPILTSGVTGSWLAWVATLGQYQTTVFNEVTFRHVFGLRSVLAGLNLPAPSLLPLGILAVMVLYMIRRQYQEIWLVNAILLTSFLFLFAHDYDLAPLSIIAVPLLLAARGRPAVLLAICLLAVIVFFPQRIWQALDLGWLARSREIALLAVLGLYLGLCRRSRTAPDPAGAAASA